ncbi:MAG: hypothetical protein MJZ65_01435 [Paludibacteraceae bacterium]|nr:hypothetical protein [Paludibacteraceae bacterium]
MNIRQWIWNARCARQPRRTPAYKDYEHISSVLLLYESDWLERNTDVRTIVNQLRADGKQVTFWGYCDKNPVQSPNLQDSRMLGKAHTNLWLMPKTEVVQDLGKRKFDVLIDLSLQPVLPLQYVALYADAGCKIGAQENTALYDMVVRVAAEASQIDLFEQIKYYLQSIKSKN